MFEEGIAPPRERQNWSTLADMQPGQSQWFPDTVASANRIRAAASYVAKKVGGRFRVAVSFNGTERGYRVWRVA